jgi:hypothetical protein
MTRPLGASISFEELRRRSGPATREVLDFCPLQAEQALLQTTWHCRASR